MENYRLVVGGKVGLLVDKRIYKKADFSIVSDRIILMKVRIESKEIAIASVYAPVDDLRREAEDSAAQ